jgi:hypothetical protein
MPKGGRKGGTKFPHLELKQAIEFTKKLVSKTHTAPQPAKVILKGVFNNSGPVGGVRVSAMRQYDLLTGSPQAYEASELAKQIDAAPLDEVSGLYRKACLNPKLFKTLYDTFQGDARTKAKIRQQAASLKVHPDSLDECVDLFINSVVFAGLATEESGNVQFTRGQTESPAGPADDTEDENPTDLDGDNGEEEESSEERTSRPPKGSPLTNKPKAHVEIKIDPSMDPEKLEKLLGVLKKYGQI